jgi:hypothetical protein
LSVLNALSNLQDGFESEMEMKKQESSTQNLKRRGAYAYMPLQKAEVRCSQRFPWTNCVN